MQGEVRPARVYFRDFVLNRVSILSFFVLIRVPILSLFLSYTGCLFLDDKQRARMFYELNYNKIIIQIII